MRSKFNDLRGTGVNSGDRPHRPAHEREISISRDHIYEKCPVMARAERYRGRKAGPCEAKVQARLSEIGVQDSLTGTLGQQYLVGLGLGFYASSPALRYVPQGDDKGVLVALITNTNTRRVQCYQTTSICLNPRTGKVTKARETDGRPATLLAEGFSPTHGAILLDSDNEPTDLVIGIDMESAASAGILFNLPALAIISARNLLRLKLSPSVRRVLVAIDTDPDSDALGFAKNARDRWTWNGLTKVEIHRPDLPPGVDKGTFNDTLLEMDAPEQGLSDAHYA